MPRAQRKLLAGYAYHVLNRADDGLFIFDDDDDARLFERTLSDAADRYPDAGLLAYCIMADHWHCVFCPKDDTILGKCMHWLTVTHTQRYHAVQGSSGAGHLYRSRFRSFPIALDEHLLEVIRYVERNPIRQGFVDRSADWVWSSAHKPKSQLAAGAKPTIAEWPVERPSRWRSWVDRDRGKKEAAEVVRLRQSVNRGTPFGPTDWVQDAAEKLALQSSLRPRGRPRKNTQ